MARTRKGAVVFSVNITEECLRLIEYLSVKDEVTQVVFIRRAIKYFMAGDRVIDKRILNKRWSDPNYIKRNALLTGYIDPKQKAQLEEVGKSQGGNFSHAFFMAMVTYCAMKITLDDSDIEITKK